MAERYETCVINSEGRCTRLTHIHDDDPDNVHVIERPEDYLSADEIQFLADEAASERGPHCGTCRCGRVIAYLHTTVEGVVHVLHPSSIEIMVEDAP